MGYSFFVEAMHNAARRFRSSERGNVLMTFALATIPMVAFVGSAVDYSRGNLTKAAMQSAVDSTALMLSKDVQKLTTAQLNQKATDIFNALLNRPDVTGVTVTPTFTNPTGGTYKLAVTAKAKIPTSFIKIVGQDDLNIEVSSQVLWGMKKLELALALDNTGSMSSSNKMTELKKAAKNLITIMKNAAKDPGDVKISIIPFAREVNVGTGSVSAAWLRWDLWEASNGTCSSNWYNKKSSCESNGKTWTPDNHSDWNGCVMDRDQDYDVLDTTPTTTIKATLFPAEQSNTCPVSVLPLSYDWTALTNKIDAMQPTGNTNVTIGLTWAWHALTANSPLTEAATASTGLDKVIILLTDGENTENRWSTSQWSIDQRTKKVCDNVKALKKPDGDALIKIYTIRVIDGNASLLQQCASKPEMYFNVTSASQLDGVFSTIAKNLANLRIAK